MVSFGFRKEKYLAYLILFPVMLMLGLWLMLNNDLVLERLVSALKGTQDGMRLEIFSQAWSLSIERLVLGHGMGFADLLGSKLGLDDGLSSHNSFLRVVLNFGILAGAIWIGMIMSIAWRCWQGRALSINVLFVSLILLSVVYGLFDELQFNKYFWVMLAAASQAPLYSLFLDGHRSEIRHAEV